MMNGRNCLTVILNAMLTAENLNLVQPMTVIKMALRLCYTVSLNTQLLILIHSDLLLFQV